MNKEAVRKSSGGQSRRARGEKRKTIFFPIFSKEKYEDLGYL